MGKPRHKTNIAWGKYLVFFIGLWSLGAIFASAWSLFVLWQNPAYGGFLWSYESSIRLYRPDDTIVHTAVRDHLRSDTFFLKVIDPEHGRVFDINPPEITAYYQERWPHCPTEPLSENGPQFIYRLQTTAGVVSETPPLPLFCFDVWDLIFQFLAVWPPAFFFWLMGFLVWRNAGNYLDDREKLFSLSSASLFFVLAAFIGKQMYLEQGIATGYGRWAILLINIPTAVLLPPAVWFTLLLIPPTRLPLKPRRRWLFPILSLIFIWSALIWGSNLLLFHPTPVVSESIHHRLSGFHGFNIILTVIGIMLMSVYSFWLGYKADSVNPLHKAQARAISWGTAPIFIVAVLYFNAHMSDLSGLGLLVTFPPQALLIMAMSTIVLSLGLGILSNQVLSQPRRSIGWLVRFGIFVIALTLTTAVFNSSSHPGQQLLLLLLIILGLITLLAYPHPFQNILRRLTFYSVIQPDDVATFVQETSRADIHTLPNLSHAIINTLRDQFNLRAVSLWLLDDTQQKYTRYQQTDHHPPLSRTSIPRSDVPNEPLDFETKLTADESSTLLLRLQHSEGRVGFLLLTSTTTHPPFPDKLDHPQLITIANHTALTIRNMREVTQARNTAVEEEDIRLHERARLGQELHDRMSTLQHLKHDLDRVRENPAHVEITEKNLVSAQMSLRTTVNDLYEESLISLDDFYTVIKKRRQQYPHIYLTADLIPFPDLPLEKRYDFGRACYQALDNALIHAQATEICLKFELSDKPHHFSFTVQDNGRGFEQQTPSELRRQGHRGLYNIASRLQRHNGSLHIKTAPQQGTTITGYIPLTP